MAALKKLHLNHLVAKTTDHKYSWKMNLTVDGGRKKKKRQAVMIKYNALRT
jgi:hypothetical protein